jgi:hypothetical protein
VFRRHRKKVKQLQQQGKRAPATVVEIASTGHEVSSEGFDPTGLSPDVDRYIVRETTLRIRPEGEPEFEVRQKIRYGDHGRFVPKTGEEIEVLYDPEDHEKVVVAPPTAEEEQIRTMEALGKAKIGFGVDLRGSGGKPSEETQQQNQEAMDQAQAMLEQAQQFMGEKEKREGKEE